MARPLLSWLFPSARLTEQAPCHPKSQGVNHFLARRSRTICAPPSILRSPFVQLLSLTLAPTLAVLVANVAIGVTLETVGRGARAHDARPSRLRSSLLALALLLVSVPIALLAAFAAFPLWSIIERTTGVEAIGHSGPRKWCFVVTYVVALLRSARVGYGRGARQAQNLRQPTSGAPPTL